MVHDSAEPTKAEQELAVARTAEEALDRVARDPDDLDAWLFLASYYMGMDLRRALEAWKQIARLCPGDYSAAKAIATLDSLLK